MTLLKTIAPENAEGMMKTVFDHLIQEVGEVPGPLKLFTASPKLWEVYYKNVDFIRSHQTLQMPLTTCLRYIVASRREYASCRDFNGMLLERFGVDESARADLVTSPETAPVSEKEKALLAFAVAAMESPEDVDQAAIDDLRQMGWQDSEIFDLTWMAAMINMLGTMSAVFNK